MEPFTPGDDYLSQIGLTREDLGGRPLYRSTGCHECLNTGYQGRIGIYELMVMTEELKNFILTTSDSHQISKRAIELGGMKTLRQDGLQKVAPAEDDQGQNDQGFEQRQAHVRGD